MSNDLNDPRLSTSEVRQIDKQCDAFEIAWNSGKQPQIEDFVAGRPELESSHLFRELLKIDIECRARAGGSIRHSQADYCLRFPIRSREIREVFSVPNPEAVAFGFASTVSMIPENFPRQIDKYELLNRIGRGGMGEVYRARHVPLNRIVALKLISAKQIENPQAVSRFKREMQAVGKLSHPNIVNATDGGEIEGTHFLAMELVDGIDLAKVVRRLGRLPVADACEIVRQTALGMAHAHEMGLIHRDLKPSNLMLDKRGQIKVLDMGLARLSDPGQNPSEIPTFTSSGQAMGTPEYMAPEQARNTTAIDQRVDIYSLGCTLYDFLVGHPPFPRSKHETPIAVLMAQLNEPIPPVELVRPELPETLVELVRRLLAKNPAERITSMNDVALQLEQFSKPSNLVALLSRARKYPLARAVEENQEKNEEPVHTSSSGSKVTFSRRHLWGAGGLALVAVAVFLWPNSGTDVLALVDPPRDRVQGDWTLNSGRLISPNQGLAILRLPHTMPAEFDLDAVVDREYGLSLSIVHVARETPFLVRFGADVEVATTSIATKGAAEQLPGTVLFASWPLHRQEASRLRMEVRKGRLLVRLNNESPLEWKGDYVVPSGLGADFDPQRAGLYLRTEGSEFLFSRLRIVDRTGQR